jgi:Na+/H+ antiporter NhaD/arsenite permease-like protein
MIRGGIRFHISMLQCLRRPAGSRVAALVPNYVPIAGYAIFFASYFVFALGKFPGLKIDRPGAAFIGGVLMVAFRVLPPGQTLSAIDFPTVVLLFSMMLLLGYLHLAGFFDFIAGRIVSDIEPRHLLPGIIFLAGTLSAFFVNDIICLAMAPFAITAAKRMGLKPVPYLLAVATASNIGSVASITGNPQNMLIGSYSGIHYRDFLVHLGPVAIAGLLLDWFVLWLLCTRNAPPAQPAADPPERKIEATSLWKPGIVIAGVLAGFLAGAPPALCAAIGASVMLVTRTREPRQIYQQVDWGLLVFFLGLFLIVGGAENAGLTQRFLEISRGLNLQNSAVFTLVSAALSNVVSNVPAVMVLKSFVPSFTNQHQGWLVLAMSSTLAGNLTITGSVANIIVIERAKAEAEITFMQYLRVGVPITLLTLLVGWLWLALVS